MKRKALILLLWLCIWQLLAIFIHNNIVLVGPVETLIELFKLIRTQEYIISIGNSFSRIVVGFFAGSAIGILFAVLSYRNHYFGDFIRPFMTMLKTVPVVSFVVLALIWFGSKNLAILISMMIVMPILYFNTLSGLQHTDKDLREMAFVYHMPLYSKVKYIYLPALYPFLVSGFQTAIGMSWKSGIAAEVIGQPVDTIGNGLYRAKIYLENGQILAWTITMVVISSVCERLFVYLLKRFIPGRKSKIGDCV